MAIAINFCTFTTNISVSFACNKLWHHLVFSFLYKIFDITQRIKGDSIVISSIPIVLSRCLPSSLATSWSSGSCKRQMSSGHLPQKRGPNQRIVHWTYPPSEPTYNIAFSTTYYIYALGRLPNKYKEIMKLIKFSNKFQTCL